MTAKPSLRNRELAAIHCAKRDLRMDDEAYRCMLYAVGRVHSAKDLDAAGRRAVLDHMRAVGGQRTPRRRVAQHPGTPHNLDRQPMLQKIEALLAELQAPWSYADAIAKRQTGIERVAWLRGSVQLEGVIAALHVELEKRELLAALDDELGRRGMTRADLAQTVAGLRRNWHRHRPTLRALVERYCHEGGE